MVDLRAHFIHVRHGTPTFLTMPFEASALWLAFCMLKTVFPSHTTLFPDIFNLVTTLPIKHQEVVDKKTLMILALAAAKKECKMRWSMAPRE